MIIIQIILHSMRIIFKIFPTRLRRKMIQMFKIFLPIQRLNIFKLKKQEKVKLVNFRKIIMILLLNAFLQQILERPSLIIKLVVESLAIPAITIRHQKILKITQSNRIEVYCWNLYPLNKKNKIKKNILKNLFYYWYIEYRAKNNMAVKKCRAKQMRKDKNKVYFFFKFNLFYYFLLFFIYFFCFRQKSIKRR